MNLRRTDFAGSWYPRSADACRREIEQFLTQGIGRDLEAHAWMGGIVPHAGWYFSGALAASVIGLLRDKEAPDIVVIFGMHLHPGSACYMMAEGQWETPLGNLAVAESLAGDLLERFDFQLETPQRHLPDNTVEVQLPIVKYLLDPAEVLAVGVPPAGRALEIGRAVARWSQENGKRTKIIGSTDLTHYGSNYDFEPRGRGPSAVAWAQQDNDRRVIDAMLAMAPERIIQEGLRNRNACCGGAVAAAISAVTALGSSQARQVAYASSFDKHPEDSFVGYAGVVFGR